MEMVLEVGLLGNRRDRSSDQSDSQNSRRSFDSESDTTMTPATSAPSRRDLAPAFGHPSPAGVEGDWMEMVLEVDLKS